MKKRIISIVFICSFVNVFAQIKTYNINTYRMDAEIINTQENDKIILNKTEVINNLVYDTIIYFNWQEGKIINKFYHQFVGPISFLPTSNSFISASVNGSIKRWDLNSGICSFTASKPNTHANLIEMTTSFDGKYIISYGDYGNPYRINIYNSSDGNVIKSIPWNTQLYKLRSSTNTNQIIFLQGINDTLSNIIIYDFINEKTDKTIPVKIELSITDLIISRDGKFILICNGEKVYLYDISSSYPPDTISFPKDCMPNFVDINQDNSQLLVSVHNYVTKDSYIQLFDKIGKVIQIYDTKFDNPKIKFSKDCKFFYSWSWFDRKIEVWAIDNNQAPQISNLKSTQNGTFLNFTFDVTIPANEEYSSGKIHIGKVGSNYNPEIVANYDFEPQDGLNPFPVTYHEGTSLSTQYLNNASLFSASGQYEFKIEVTCKSGLKSTYTSAGIESANNKLFYYSMPSQAGYGTPGIPSGLSAISDGQNVGLTWNSSENSDYYDIYRNGVLIKQVFVNEHPASITAEDIVPFSTKKSTQGNDFQYQIKSANTSTITQNASNTVSVTSSTNTNQYGSIIGTIKDGEGNRIENVKVNFSHDNKTIVSGDGNYCRSAVSYNSKGTITLSKSGYTFEPKDGTANYDINSKTLRIHFLAKKKTNDNQNNYDNVAPVKYELQLASKINENLNVADFKTGQSHTFSLTVKNISSAKWTGYLIVALRQSDLVETYQIAKLGVTDLESGAEKYVTFTTDKINVQPGNYQVGLISCRKNLVNTFLCPIMPYLVFKNPIAIEVKPAVEALKTIDEMLNEIDSKLKGSIAFSKFYGYTKNIYDVGFNDQTDLMASNIFFEMSEYLKTAKDAEAAFAEIIGLINNVNDIVKEEDEINQYFKFANFIIGQAGFAFPFTKILTEYLKAPVKASDAIERITDNVYDDFVGTSLLEKPYFAIKVRKKGYFTSYFTQEELSRNIEKISISGKNNSIKLSPLEMSKSFSIGSRKDKNTLYSQIISYISDGSLYGDSNSKLFVKIKWTNGRTSIVPLSKKFIEYDGAGSLFEGVTIKFQANTKTASDMASEIQLLFPSDK